VQVIIDDLTEVRRYRWEFRKLQCANNEHNNILLTSDFFLKKKKENRDLCTSRFRMT
jgi:hypothetical protein